MKLHKGKGVAAVAGWVAVIALSAGPLVAVAGNAHYGFQNRGAYPGDGSNGNSNGYNNNNNDGDDNSGNDCSDPPQVPEPGTLALTLGGLTGLLVIQRRRRSK